MSDDAVINLYTFDNIPGERFFVENLQKPIKFSIKEKTIKQGRLLLFKRTHYYIQISLQTAKNTRENFEIPFPFKVEEYNADGLMYYDYRVNSLNLENDHILLTKRPSSTYYNKILEIQTQVI